MLTREQVFSFARSLPESRTDCPFEGDFDTTVLRHTDSGKWFGLLFRVAWRNLGIDRVGETDIVNLKCDPLLSDILFQNYRGVCPAYHMNKRLWITIVLDGDVPLQELYDRIRMSYELTGRPKPDGRMKKRKAGIEQ